MPEERDVKKIYKWQLITSRSIGGPKIRWMDNVMQDIEVVKFLNWKRCPQDRSKWKSIVEHTKIHVVW
jgi:hypothetical protein